MRIFVSYARKDKRTVLPLISALDQLGHDIWYDKALSQSGGQNWWAKIVTEILQCDLFVFALSQRSLASVPCSHELEYAHSLSKRILPIAIGRFSQLELPSELQEIQYIEYKSSSQGHGLALAASLSSLPNAKPLPDPLPHPPPAPINRLDRVARKNPIRRILYLSIIFTSFVSLGIISLSLVINSGAISSNGRGSTLTFEIPDTNGVLYSVASLQTAIDKQDWDTAASIFEHLRDEQNIDNTVIDTIFITYPKLRTRLVQQYAPRWSVTMPSDAIPITQHRSSLTALAISSSGTRIITGDIDGLIKVTGQYGSQGNDLVIRSNTTLISSIAVDPKGRWFITTSDDEYVNVWSLSNGQKLNVLKGHTAFITAIAVEARGTLVAIGSRDKSILLWRPSSDWSQLPEPIKIDTGLPVSALAFSLDSKLLAVANADGLVTLWNVDTNQVVAKTAKATAYITEIVFRPRMSESDPAEFITIGNQNIITLWSADGQKIGDLSGHSDDTWVRSASFTADGNMLASVDTDNRILLWNMSKHELAKLISSSAADVYSLQFSLEAKQLVAINLGGGVFAWPIPIP